MTRAQFSGFCLACSEPINVGDSIVRDVRNSRVWIHETCPIRAENLTNLTDQTRDERYNALCQTVDRIMTGNPRIRVIGGAKSAIAETWRDDDLDKLGHERALVRFDHPRIVKWSKSGWDRTALTLALNLHELGHIWHTPGASGMHEHTETVVRAFNILEDARQEMLVSLQYPKALDYLRFLNARALSIRMKDVKTDDERGREFILYYGRRHLFPRSVNRKLYKLALKKYGLPTTKRIQHIIDTYMQLSLPAQMMTAWDLAEQLDAIDNQFDGKTFDQGVLVGLGIGDPRHDCLPEPGSKPATLSDEEKGRLLRALKQLIEREPDLAEPTDEEKERTGKERGEWGESDLPQEEKRDHGEKGNETLDGQGDEKSDEGADSQREEGDNDTPPETAGEQEGEGSTKGTSPSQTRAVEEGKAKQSEARGGQGAGHFDEELENAIKILRVVEDKALDQVEKEIDSRHDAIRGSELKPQMGGTRKGALSPEHLDHARRLSRLFHDINLDLSGITERGKRRGKLDGKRVISAVSRNNQRVFRRRVEDLSKDAELGVHIMVDVSGSMERPVVVDGKVIAHSAVEVALDAGFTIAKAIDTAGHLSKVTEFSDENLVQKNWHDSNYREHDRAGSGGTSPLPGLTAAMPDFAWLERESNVHNHVLIIITDGQWSSPKECATKLRQMVARGVHIIEIGVGVAPLKIEGAWKIMTIPDVPGLTSAMTKPLRDLSIEIAKSIRRRIA